MNWGINWGKKGLTDVELMMVFEKVSFIIMDKKGTSTKHNCNYDSRAITWFEIV